MNIDEIRELLKSGDVAGAEAAAKAALETEPDNVRLMIVFGTCRQLQGDEEAFRSTFELVKAALTEKKVELDATAVEEWKRYEALHKRIAQPELLQNGDPPREMSLMTELVIIVLLVAAAGAVAFACLGRATIREVEVSCKHLYAGPPQAIIEVQQQRENATTASADSSHNKFKFHDVK